MPKGFRGVPAAARFRISYNTAFECLKRVEQTAFRPGCAGVAEEGPMSDHCLSEYPVQEPPLRSGLRVLAVAGAINPEALSSVVLNPEIITHGGKFGIALPPFAEHAFWTVGAPDPAAYAAPGECGGWMVGQERYRLDWLGFFEQTCRSRPAARPGRLAIGCRGGHASN